MCVVQCAPRHILILSTNLFPFVVLCPTRIRTPGFSRRTPLTITMSHFGRSGPPDIRDTYSLLVLNITFRIFLSFFLFFFFFDYFVEVLIIFFNLQEPQRMICTHYSIGMAKSSMSSSLVIAGRFRFYQFTQFYFLGFKFIFRVFGFI